MERIAKAHMWVLNAMKVGSGLVIFGVFIVIVVDVALTIMSKWDVGVVPWDRTHGFVEYGLLWFTMLAAPWLARIKGHVFIDAVTQLLSSEVQKVTARFAYLVAFSGSTALAYFSTGLLIEAYVNEFIDDRGADFFQWMLFLPMPFGFGLVAVEFLRYLLGFDNMYGDRTEVREGM